MTTVEVVRWNRCQRAAVLLAPIPMVLGLTILGLWFATGWDVLPIAGIFTMWFGVATTLAVCVFVALGWAHAAHAGSPFRRCVVPAALAMSVMIANYPVAWFAFDTALARGTAYTITIVNEADSPWTELQLVAPGVDVSPGTLPPRGSVTKRVWFSADGTLVLRERTAAGEREHEVEGYVCRHLGGDTTVTRDVDGVVRVLRSNR